MRRVSVPRLPTYRSIAEECGIGKTTVGRVLNNSGYVAEDVRRRVLDAAARLGYRFDPALAALSRRRWPQGAGLKTVTLAYVHNGVRTTGSPLCPEFSGLLERAQELGYSVDTFCLHDYPSSSALSRVIHARGIQGVLIQAFRDNVHLDLEWERFFTVFIGPENDQAHVHNVQADFRSALHLAIQACRRHGYRRIGLALMNHFASGTNVPLHAQALYERLGLEQGCPQPALFNFEPRDDSYALRFARWLRLEKPDVVVSTNIHPYYWITSARHYDRRKKNLRIPLDVAFVCFRSYPDVPHMAHVDLRERDQGRQAVDLVHQQLQHGAIGRPEMPLRLLVPPRWVDGASLPRLGG